MKPLLNLSKFVSQTSPKYLQNHSELSFLEISKISPNTSLKVTIFPQKKIFSSGHFRHLRPHEKDITEMFRRYPCSVGVQRLLENINGACTFRLKFPKLLIKSSSLVQIRSITSISSVYIMWKCIFSFKTLISNQSFFGTFQFRHFQRLLGKYKWCWHFWG